VSDPANAGSPGPGAPICSALPGRWRTRRTDLRLGAWVPFAAGIELDPRGGGGPAVVDGFPPRHRRRPGRRMDNDVICDLGNRKPRPGCGPDQGWNLGAG